MPGEIRVAQIPGVCQGQMVLPDIMVVFEKLLPEFQLVAGLQGLHGDDIGQVIAHLPVRSVRKMLAGGIEYHLRDA